MPMRYANEDDVLTQLGMTRLDAGYARLVRVENGLCDTFDAKTGRSFGVVPRPETREVSVASFTQWLVLETPIRTVTSIEVAGTWNGTDWTGSTVLADRAYRLVNRAAAGFYGIYLSHDIWSGVVRITGIWADQPEYEIPDDVREALTFITVDEYRTRNASPAGEIGPDGLMVRARNPWRFELVAQAIERHQVARILI